MSDLNAIKEKIRRLLATAENHASAEAEVEAAMRVAAHLMQAHQLSREDISNLSEAERAGRIEYGRRNSFSWGVNLTAWEASLACFVRDFVGTVHCYTQAGYRKRLGGKVCLYTDDTPWECTRVIFYGPDEDARFAVELFEEILIATASLAQNRWGGFARGAGASYCQGFVAGIAAANRKAVQALEAPAADGQTRALVLRNQANALVIREDGKRWLERQHKVKLGRGRRRGGVTAAGWNRFAYEQGREEGTRYAVGGKTPPPKQIPG